MKRSLAATLMAAVTILSLLAGGAVANAMQPRAAVPPTSATVVIDQVRTHGPAGLLDQSIRITNISDAQQDIGNLTVQYAAGSTFLIDLATIPAGTVLDPKKSYLLASIGYSGLVPPNQYFTHPLDPPFVLALQSATGEVIDKANIPPGFCHSGVYVRGIPDSSFYCAPRSGSE
ncbi:hypothetical protein GCM10010174_56320 [Kutzneria viridogrisea]|uniref:LTD domain-containing protein n=1 Tax=Kutzneria viridogrisea TaxID=47990 RepID=A0ABR6BKW4_9PSEU|nr:hypothetical protein [Kutzneria viridogrisea]